MKVFANGESTTSLLDWWRHALDPVQASCSEYCLHFWEVIGIWFTGAATFGAVLVSLYLARQGERTRVREQIIKECGKANRLITTLGRMLSILEDLKETLFDQPAKRLGRPPQWNEIGGLQGFPQRIPRVEVSEYDFLLETEKPNDRAAEVLGHIEHVQTLTDSIMAMIQDRTACAYQLQAINPTAQFTRGDAAITPGINAATLKQRLKELTDGLASDVPEAISSIKSVVPQLRTALEARYPGRQFLLLLPTNPKEPAL
jgi:hypothetical protein